MELPDGIKNRMQVLLESDLSRMSPDKLTVFQKNLNTVYSEIESLEPEDPDSEEFLDWEETLELLDDLTDDVNDRLDSLG